MKGTTILWPAVVGLGLVALVALLPLGGGPSSVQGATATLVPNADKTNAGAWTNEGSNTCVGSSCYLSIDDDIASPNDADFVKSVPDPVDRRVEFELEDAPSDVATLTGMTVRFRAFQEGGGSASALVEVFTSAETPLDPTAAPQPLSATPTTYPLPDLRFESQRARCGWAIRSSNRQRKRRPHHNDYRKRHQSRDRVRYGVAIAVAERHAYADGVGEPDGNGDSDRDRHRDGDRDGHGYAHRDGDAHRGAIGDADGYAEPHSDCDGYAERDAFADGYGEP